MKNFCSSNHDIAANQRNKMEKLNASFHAERTNLSEKASRLEETYRKESYSVTPTTLKRPRTPYMELAENIKALNFMNNK